MSNLAAKEYKAFERIKRISIVIYPIISLYAIIFRNEWISAFHVQENLFHRLPKGTALDIYHHNSKEEKCLQIADLFCWGLFQKYENKDTKWVELFKDKVAYDEIYTEI